jgi:hypothetical protein
MFLSQIIKKPLLPIGILITYLLIHNLEERGIINLSKRKEILKATSCRAVLIKLDRRIPKSWKTNCHENNLTISIDKTLKKIKNKKSIKQYLYRELANDIIFTAKHSPNDNLERVLSVRFILNSKIMDINAITFGEDISKFYTLKNKRLILKHLKNTVHVKEIIK